MSTYTPHGHKPYGSDGSGFYGDFAEENIAVINDIQPVVTKALEAVKLDEKNNVFTIADYGTADGAVSIPLISSLIERIKKRFGKDQEIQVIHEDQPVNDFKSVFFRLHGIKKGTAETYLEKYSGVYSLACGTNFYDQCVPNKSVNLSVSTLAAHWLHQIPGLLGNDVVHCVSNDASEKAKYAKEGEKNWKRFLLHRASELAPGGQMVVVLPAIDENGYYFGFNHRVKESAFINLGKLWKTMADDGIITWEEFTSTAIGIYMRTAAEAELPFKDRKGEVYESGLRLVSMQNHFVKDPTYDRYINTGADTDEQRLKYARYFVAAIRRWSNSCFLDPLNKSRSEDEKMAILDEFYSRYEDLVAAAPKEHSRDHFCISVHCRKVEQ